MDANHKGFALLLHGELSLVKDRYTAWQMPSMDIVVGIDLDEAVRDQKAFDEAARIIGRIIMERGVRYAARGVRRWQREAPPMPKTPTKAGRRLAALRSRSKP